MSALGWGIKASLLDYVRGMPDGTIETSNGAGEGDAGFVFPGLGDDAFGGTVTLTGHGGMMRVTISDPALVRGGEHWLLTIADPGDPGIRLPFARIAAIDTGSDGVRRATGTVLTGDGADLFFGPYTAGTPLDDPVVLP